MSRLIVIGSVAVASAALLTGTAAAVGVVASKSQPATGTTNNSQIRVVAPAAAVTNETVKKAITVASAKPKPLPTVKVHKVKTHHNLGGSAGTSTPRVITLYNTASASPTKHRVVVVTVTGTPSTSPSPTSTHHEDGGDGQGDHHHSHSPNPSASPTAGGGDD
jgi:hypothetical protein